MNKPSGVAICCAGFVSLCGALAPSLAIAQKSAAEVARELANPNTTLGFMSFNNDYIRYDGDLPGASSQEAYITSFQPSLPYKISDKWNFFARPLIPIIWQQPVFQNGNFKDESSTIGDIGFDLALGTGFANGFTFIAGVAGSLPTASNDDLSTNQRRLGPELLVGQKTAWGFYGGLFSHVWDVGGSNNDSTSITSGQYFFTYNLPDAWQIQMQPTWSYNHEADKSGDKLTFPLGIGVSKTVIFGKTPVKFNLQYWDYVAAPDAFGQDKQVRFSISPVIPLPW